MDMSKLNKIISMYDIEKSVREKASEIWDMYYPDELILLCCLKGAFRVTELLVKYLKDYPSLNIEFAKISSYIGKRRGDFYVELFPHNLGEKNVIIVEDVIDSGETIKEVYQLVYNQTESIKIFTLLQKGKKEDITIDFSCFEIPDNIFVVGFGLDYNENLRNLNGIYNF